MKVKSRFGTVLADMRSGRGLSARKFAEVCGLNRETYRQYEAGKVLPPNQGLLKILGALQLDPWKSEEAKRLIAALHNERGSKDLAEKRAFGVAANTELRKYLKQETLSADKTEKIVDLFFEHLPTERSESMEHFIKREIARILEN